MQHRAETLEAIRADDTLDEEAKQALLISKIAFLKKHTKLFKRLAYLKPFATPNARQNAPFCKRSERQTTTTITTTEQHLPTTTNHRWPNNRFSRRRSLHGRRRRRCHPALPHTPISS